MRLFDLAVATKLAGGGGGGGGAAEASVAFVVSGGASATAYQTFVIVGSPGERYLTYSDEVSISSNITVTMPLIDGYAGIGFSTSSTVTITGDAEYIPDDELIVITGDCTITLS